MDSASSSSKAEVGFHFIQDIMYDLVKSAVAARRARIEAKSDVTADDAETGEAIVSPLLWISVSSARITAALALATGNSFSPARRREAVHVGGLHVEVRALRRADAPLPQAYGTEALQVPALPAQLLALRPLITAHEAPLNLTRRLAQPFCTSRGPADSVQDIVQEDVVVASQIQTRDALHRTAPASRRPAHPNTSSFRRGSL